MFDLINIFEVFLPQLLLYPNPSDPLNGEAANLLLKNPEKYKEKTKEYVKKYATEIKEKKIIISNDENDNNEFKEAVSVLSELSNASLKLDDDNDI